MKINGNKGKPKSEAMREKLRQYSLSIHRVPPSRKGCKHSDASKSQMSATRIEKGIASGENNPFWKGGVTSIPGYFSRARRAYDLRKRGNGGSHTALEWIELKKMYGNACAGCSRKEPEVKLTEDHVHPVSLGGSDDISNIQPLCGLCNSLKGVKIIRYAIPIAV